MLHGNETWAVNVEDMQRLERNETDILHLMCNVSEHVQQNPNVLTEELGRNGTECPEESYVMCKRDSSASMAM